MVSPAQSEEEGLPIPTNSSPSSNGRRKGSRVLQSSLEIAFSYSRSQQRRYGNIQSAPSFVDPSSTSWSSGEPLDEEDLVEEEEEDEEEDNARRRSESVSPSIFPSDPDPFARIRVSPPQTNTIDGLPASRPHTGTGTSLIRDQLRSSSLASQASRREISPGSSAIRPALTECTPLLAKGDADGIGVYVEPSSPTLSTGRRRSSQGNGLKRRKSGEVGKSTNGQTLFNAIAVLVGIGLLSLPLAFAYAGWIGGTALLFGFAFITCYTAKLLARLILTDRSLLGYTDIGKRAFGGWASGFINVLFCLELFALSVALVVLFGDTLSVIFPSISSNTFKAIGFIIILPTTLLPLHLLSLPSLLSTLSSLLLIAILLLDGILAKTLTHPAHTNIGPEWKNGNWLGGVGLVLAGFGGHAVVPGLARDMKHPGDFEKVINRAFIIATALSFIAGSAGYLMIGNNVSDEITRDLLQPKYNYPRKLNLFALWMIVINPITKFGLCTRPLNVTIESILSINPSLPGDESQIFTSSLSNPEDTRDRVDNDKIKSKENTKAIFRVGSRIVTTGVCVITAILLPGFGKVMAFLGSFSAFLICIILPLLFHLRLAPKMLPTSSNSTISRIIHWVLVVISVGLMMAGTVWAFIPGLGHGGLDDGR